MICRQISNMKWSCKYVAWTSKKASFSPANWPSTWSANLNDRSKIRPIESLTKIKRALRSSESDDQLCIHSIWCAKRIRRFSLGDCEQMLEALKGVHSDSQECRVSPIWKSLPAGQFWRIRRISRSSLSQSRPGESPRDRGSALPIN